MRDFLIQLLDGLLPIIATTLITILGIGLNKLLASLKTKLDANSAAVIEDVLNKAVTDAVNYAEEQAHKKLSRGEKISSGEKKEQAVAFVSETLKNAGVKKAVEPVLIEKKVESAVNKRRAS